MHITDCWALLEIAPIQDLKEIRRAYARKLKTIDVLADPKAFVTLRGAYDAARSALAPQDPHDLLPGEEVGPDGPALATMQAIDALLASKAGREAIFGPLSEQTEHLVRIGHADDLERSVEIERWLADTIVSRIPHSNGMLAPAVTGFFWDDRAGDHDCPDAIVTAVGRYKDFQFLQRMQAINPHYLSAWIALTEGASDLSEVHIASMSTLLGMIQHQRPNLLDDVDIAHFRRWTDYLEDQRRIERQKSLLDSIKPEPPMNPLLQIPPIIVCIVLGLAMMLIAFVLTASSKPIPYGHIIAIPLFAVGFFLVIIGNDQRARLGKRLSRAKRDRIRQ